MAEGRPPWPYIIRVSSSTILKTRKHKLSIIVLFFGSKNKRTHHNRDHGWILSLWYNWNVSGLLIRMFNHQVSTLPVSPAARRRVWIRMLVVPMSDRWRGVSSTTVIRRNCSRGGGGGGLVRVRALRLLRLVAFMGQVASIGERGRMEGGVCMRRRAIRTCVGVRRVHHRSWGTVDLDMWGCVLRL